MGSKILVYLVCLAFLSFVATYTYAKSNQNDIGGFEVDDLDSFFDDVDDGIDEDVRYGQPTTDNTGSQSTQEAQQAPEPEIVYVPEEPIPEFENDIDKYIYYARKYLIEIFLAMLAGVFILNIYYGQKVNCKIAAMWLTEVLPILDKNFAHLGFGEEKNLSLSQLTYSDYEYYASGRDFCHYLFMHMKTKKRQDVVSSGLLGIIWPETDRVIIDIPIDVELPLELLICRKNQVKKTQQEMPNINQLIAPVKSESFENMNYAVLAETKETVDIVFTNKLMKLLEAGSKYLEFLHITDQRVYTAYPVVLKAEINLGDSPADYKTSAKVVELLLELVDHIANNVRLPDRVLQKAKKNRAAEEKKREQERQERIQEEKEQKREEKEREIREKLKKMAPAERKKYEEKLRKMEKKKEMKGKNRVMKF